MNKKRLRIFILFIVLAAFSLYIVHAINPSQVNELVLITKTGTTEHGNYEFRIEETALEDCESGYVGVLRLSAEAGYYVKGLSVTFDSNDLQLGFVAGSEHGGHFRPYNFSPAIDEYQFYIPTEATADNKVIVEIEYAERTPIDITYLNYTGTTYNNKELTDINNYDLEHEELLVTEYVDGDIVLPEDCTGNGCALKLQFDSEEDYNEYKSIIYYDYTESWISAEAVLRDENRDFNTLITDKSSCNEEDDNYYCYIVVSKDFNEVSYGSIAVGYTPINIYTTDFVGFEVRVDVDNFADIISELGNNVIAFNNNKIKTNIEIFYGTKKLQLVKKTPRPIVNHSQPKKVVTLKGFDSVSGSGYAYNTSYDDGILTVNINSYYQDKITLELDISKNSQSVFGDNVEIELNRFAFSGNAGQLLEVDSEGRNCDEENNDNTCDQRRYYSTQYRGVLSAFYTNDDDDGMEVDSAYEVVSIEGNTINMTDRGVENLYHRNKNFNPHAIALFYDSNNMIVETKDFDLNEEIEMEGYITKDKFNELFSGYTVTPDLNTDYIYMGNRIRTSINNIEYFGSHLGATIMHDLVLIGKEEAREKDIVKIALFLVNGDIEEDSIPSLTYGVGEGKVLMIRGDE